MKRKLTREELEAKIEKLSSEVRDLKKKLKQVYVLAGGDFDASKCTLEDNHFCKWCRR